MQLTTSKKIMATGAALLGVVLGAAGISAAATASGGTTHRAPAVAHAQESTDAGRDVPEANDKPDGVEHEDSGTDVGETDGQG